MILFAAEILIVWCQLVRFHQEICFHLKSCCSARKETNKISRQHSFGACVGWCSMNRDLFLLQEGGVCWSECVAPVKWDKCFHVLLSRGQTPVPVMQWEQCRLQSSCNWTGRSNGVKKLLNHGASVRLSQRTERRCCTALRRPGSFVSYVGLWILFYFIWCGGSAFSLEAYTLCVCCSRVALSSL